MANGRNTALKVLVQDRTGRPLDELLRELYVDDVRSARFIANALTQKLAADNVKVARTTVNDWLREYGITRDDRPAVAL